jgi:hypothetical protein
MPFPIVIAIGLGVIVAIFATNDGKWKKFGKNDKDKPSG